MVFGKVIGILDLQLFLPLRILFGVLLSEFIYYYLFSQIYDRINSILYFQFPLIGELLIKRCIIQFKRAFRRNDKATCITVSMFIAHLVNQRMVCMFK